MLTPTPQPASSELGVVDISLYLFGTSWMKIAITPVKWSGAAAGPDHTTTAFRGVAM